MVIFNSLLLSEKDVSFLHKIINEKHTPQDRSMGIFVADSKHIPKSKHIYEPFEYPFLG